MICPKCGFEQLEALECVRCGVIIGKFRPPGASVAPAGAGGAAAAAQSPGSSTRAPLGVPALVDRFDSGGVLGETFRVYGFNLGAFLAIGAIAVAPLFFRAGWLAVRPGVADWQLNLLLDGGLRLVTAVIAVPVATAAMTYGVFQTMRGQTAQFGACLRVGLACLLPAAGVAILYFLAFWAGFLLCMAPALWVMTVLAVAIPVAVEERVGPVAALQKSARLTEGHRLHVFLVIGALVLIKGGIWLGLAGLYQVWDPVWFQASVEAAVEIFTTGLAATAAGVMYYRLRSLKESIDVSQIASIFD